MASVLSQGLRPTGILQQADRPIPAATPDEVAASGLGEFGRGLRSARKAMLASDLRAQGLQAEIDNDPQRAQAMYDMAAEADRAGAIAPPRVRSLRDINSVRDAIDFAAGGAPQAIATTVPVVAGALAGRVLGGSAGAYIGGAIPAFQLERNETVGELAQDEQARARLTPQEIQNLGSAKALANAALEVVGPGYVVNKMLGGARGGALRTLRNTMAAESATEASQQIPGDMATSYARTGTPSVDPMNVADAAALGAMGGGILASPAVATQAIGGVLDAASQQAAIDNAKTPQTPLDRWIRTVGTGDDSLVQTVVSPQEMPEDVADEVEWLVADDARRNSAAASIAQRYVEDPTTPEEVRRAAEEFLAGEQTGDAWASFSEVVRTYERAKRARGALDKLTSGFKNAKRGFEDGFTGKPGSRQNAQAVADPFDRLFARTMYEQIIGDDAGYIDADLATRVAAGVPVVRNWIQNGFKDKTGEIEVPDGVEEVFADPVNAVQTLHALMRRQGLVDEQSTEALTEVIAELQNRAEARKDLAQIVRDNLTPTAEETVRTTDLEQLAWSLRDWIEHGNERVLTDSGFTRTKTDFEAVVDELFGPNKERVLEALRRTIKTRAPVLDASTGAARLDEDPEDVADREAVEDMTNEIQPNEVKAKVRYTGSYDTRNEGSAAGLKKHLDDYKTLGYDAKAVSVVDKLRAEVGEDQAAFEAGMRELLEKYGADAEKIMTIQLTEASDKRDPIDIPGSEFAVRGTWELQTGRNNEYGGPEKGVLWFQRVGDKRPMAISASRLITRMRQGMKDVGGNRNEGVVDQYDMLMQGISSILSSKKDDGSAVFDGRVGILENGEVKWLDENSTLPDNFKLPTGTVADVRPARVEAHNNKLVDEMTRWADNNEDTRVGEAAAVRKAIKEKNYDRLEKLRSKFVKDDFGVRQDENGESLEGGEIQAMAEAEEKAERDKPRTTNEDGTEVDPKPSAREMQTMKQVAFLLDTLRKGIPAFSAVVRQLAGQRKKLLDMRQLLRYMVESSDPKAEVWHGRPPKNMAAFKVRADRALEILNTALDKPEPPGGGRRMSAMAVRIHNDLGRSGFAATHDSPIRHEGRFNWRANLGRGEGNAAFGAGTYLSTAEGVHKSYKAQFTAMLIDDPRFKGLVGMHALDVLNRIRAKMPNASMARVFSAAEAELDELATNGPAAKRPVYRLALKDIRTDREVYERALNAKSLTYEVSVDIAPEQLLNWDAPISGQSQFVREALRKAGVKTEGVVTDITSGSVVDRVELDGATIYKELAKKLGSQAKASDYLQSLGILGHRYAAAGGKNDKFPNYVIYDDSRITTNYVSFNKQSAHGNFTQEPLTAEQREKIIADVRRRLGPQVAVEFGRIFGPKNADGFAQEISGEWLDDLIRISINAESPSQIGAHESMHGFFSRILQSKNDRAHRVLQILLNAANSKPVVRQLERLLIDHPAALEQIKEGSPHYQEERLAYMFQFWQAGLLTVGPETKTVFQKIADFFRRVVGLLSEDQKAVDIMRAFEAGKMQTADAAAKVLAENIEYRERILKDGYKVIKPLLDKTAMLLTTSEEALVNSKNPALVKIAHMFKNPTGESGVEQSYFEAHTQQQAYFMNMLNAVLEGKNPKDLELALRFLREGDATKKRPQINDKIISDIYDGVRTVLDDMYDYMTKAGVKRKNDRGEWETPRKVKEYFPHAFDISKIGADPAGFVKALLDRHTKELTALAQSINRTLPPEAPAATAASVAESIMHRMVNSYGQMSLDETEGAVGFSPLMSAVNSRDLTWLDTQALADYMNDDLVNIMATYIVQGTKRAEYTRRFGPGGEGLRNMMEEARQIEMERLVEERYGVKGALKMMEDDDRTKGDKSSAEKTPWLERFAKAAGLEMDQAKEIEKDALETMGKYGREVMALEGTLGYDINPTMRRLSSVAVVYENFRLLALSLFSQFIDPLGIAVRGGTMKEAWEAYLRGLKEIKADWTGKKSTDFETQIAEYLGTVDSAGFLANFGQLHNSMYLGGKARKLNEALFRWNGMDGFNRGIRIQATQAAIQFLKRHKNLPDGDVSKGYLEELNLTPDDIIVDAEGNLNYDDPKIREAIFRWVNGAVLRPNAGQRPSWMSDPHFMIFAHMKQFSFAFHDTILKRVWRDAKRDGNLAPAAIMLSTFVPTMIAADTAKALIFSAGTEPAFMQQGLGETIMHGVNRAGVFGKYQPLVEVFGPSGVAGLAGPTIEHAVDAFTQPLSETLKDSLPGASAINTMQRGWR